MMDRGSFLQGVCFVTLPLSLFFSPLSSSVSPAVLNINSRLHLVYSLLTVEPCVGHILTFLSFPQIHYLIIQIPQLSLIKNILSLHLLFFICFVLSFNSCHPGNPHKPVTHPNRKRKTIFELAFSAICPNYRSFYPRQKILLLL